MAQPIVINTVADLENINSNLSGDYVLGADLDLTGVNFTPIGDAALPFIGTFDGAGHTIDSLNLAASLPDVGPFGYVGEGGVIENVGVTNANASAIGANVGILAGTNNGSIIHSYATGTVEGNGGDAGLVGFNYYQGNISQSYFIGTVTENVTTSQPSAGGLVAQSAGTITQSFSAGAVIGGYNVGGITGANAGSIDNSYSTSSVFSSSLGTAGDAGGLVGVNIGGSIQDLYSTGSVGGITPGAFGGLIGIERQIGTISESYWDTQTSGQQTSAAGTGLATTQLNSALPSGFDPAVWGESSSINNGYPYLFWQAPPDVPPVINSISTSSSSGELGPSSSITFTVTFSKAVTVTSGVPTLALNDGGSAIYQSGSASTALTFLYTVGKLGSGQNTPDLALAANTAFQLNGASITDAAGTAADLSAANGYNPAGTLKIDTTDPIVTSVSTSPAIGDLNGNQRITITVSFDEAVKVKGTPALTLNDGGTATFNQGASKPGSGTLVFDYKVGTGQSTPALAVSGISVPKGGSIQDSAGHNADFTNAEVTFAGLHIDTTPPAATNITASQSSGTLRAGDKLTITLTMSEAVKISGTPSLKLNDGGSASYVSGTGTKTLTFTYTLGRAEHNVGNLTVAQVSLGQGASISDLAGNRYTAAALNDPLGIQVQNYSYGVDYRIFSGGATSGMNIPNIAAYDGVGAPPTAVPYLHTGGTQFVGAYLGSFTKNDAMTFADNHLAIVSLFEDNPTSAGYFTTKQADKDVAAAIADASAVGQTTGAIYFTVDPPADPISKTFMNAVDSYFQEIRTQLDKLHDPFQLGVYGPGDVLSTLVKDSKVHPDDTWLALYSYPTSGFTGENIDQVYADPPGRLLHITKGDKQSVDLDKAITTQFGQWYSSPHSTQQLVQAMAGFSSGQGAPITENSILPDQSPNGFIAPPTQTHG